MANGNLKKLAGYLSPYRKILVWGVVALAIVNVLGVYIPLLIRNGIDELQGKLTIDRILFYAGAIVGLASLMWVIRMYSRITIFGVGRKVEFDLKQQIFTHLLQMEPDYFSRNTVGDLISRSTSDVENMRRLMGFAVLSLANTAFAYALTLPVMLHIDTRLTLLSLAAYPVMLVLVQAFSHQLRSQQLKVQEELSAMSDLIQEDMSGIAPIKIYAQEKNEQEAFEELNQRLYRANLALTKTRTTLFPMLGGLASISFLVLLWFGADEIAANRLSVGNLIALLIYIERLIFPTALLGFTISAYQRGEVSIARIEAILTAQPAVADTPEAIALPLDQVTGRLEARNLNYTYPGASQPALKGINFTIEPGERVAIVGPVGGGKSTLANILPRLLNVAPGQLWLDGVDITQIRLADLRAAIAYVPQESFLFSASIANNIRYGDPMAEFEVVKDAATESEIHQEIQTFPKQYETVVGERGITLSGGQRQRSSLARALVVDAPIVILDDALSSVDNQTATKILHNLDAGTQKKTVIFVSHQLSAAATADRILVIDQGQIVATGRHEDLLEQAGLYRTLWQQHDLEAALL